MADSFVFGRHDLALEDTDSDMMGLMCAQDKGVPIYEEHDSKYLVDQYYTGTPDQTYIDPEKEIPLVQSDYRSGFGLEVADPNDPLRYYASYGADLRHRGMAIAGNKTTAVTIPSNIAALTLVNGDMELTTGWTNGVRDATHKNGGTYGWKVDNETAYQALTTWNNDYRNTVIKVQCYVWADAGAHANISVTDGTDTTTSSNHSGGSTFELLTVTHQINAAGSKIQIQMTAGAPVAWFDDYTIVYEPTIGVGSFAEFNDELYWRFGNILTKQNAGGTAFTAIYSFPALITDLEVFPNSTAAGEDILLIAQGTSDAYWEMTAAEAFTINTLANNTMQFMMTVHAATPTMWANDTTSTIRKTTDPADGGTAWSGQTQVDTTYNAITDLITKSGALYIPKEDMIYYLDSNEAVQNDLAPKLRALTSSTSGKNAITDGDKIMYPAGDQALLEIDGTTLTWRTPASYVTNLSDFNGRVFAVAFDDQYWFVVLDNSTKVEILAGREETIDSTTRFVWHPIHEMTLTGVETLFVSSIFQKRLWISSTASSDSLSYMPLPTGYGDIINDANRDFKTDTYFYTSWQHGGFKADDKAFYKATATLGHTYDVDIYFELWYKKLGDADWTDAGDFKGTSTNRKPVLYIPVDGSSNKPVSTMMYFKIVVKTDDVLKTPQLLNFDVRAILYPARTDVILTRIIAAQEITLRDGTTETNQMNVIKTLIDNITDSTWPRKFYPIDYNPTDDNFIYVKPLPLPRGTKKRDVIRDEEGRLKEYAYNLFLQEVTLA